MFLLCYLSRDVIYPISLRCQDIFWMVHAKAGNNICFLGSYCFLITQYQVIVWVLINITCAYFGYIVENKAEKQHHTLSRSASFSSHTSCLSYSSLTEKEIVPYDFKWYKFMIKYNQTSMPTISLQTNSLHIYIIFLYQQSDD